MIVEAGGNGINVRKAIYELGGESLVVFPSGCINGKVLEEYLDSQQLKYKAVCVNGNSRESFNFTEMATNSQYRFVMPSCILNKGEIDLVFNVLCY